MIVWALFKIMIKRIKLASLSLKKCKIQKGNTLAHLNILCSIVAILFMNDLTRQLRLLIWYDPSRLLLNMILNVHCWSLILVIIVPLITILKWAEFLQLLIWYIALCYCTLWITRLWRLIHLIWELWISVLSLLFGFINILPVVISPLTLLMRGLYHW
jgi:hypothetical protein